MTEDSTATLTESKGLWGQLPPPATLTESKGLWGQLPPPATLTESKGLWGQLSPPATLSLSLSPPLTRANRPWFCYMLVTADGGRQKSYVGATVDPDHRLRQHNGELTGGAKATHGRRWTRRYLIGGFTDERTALQFEWWWKKHTRDLRSSSSSSSPKFNFLECRDHALSLNLANYPMATILEGGV